MKSATIDYFGQQVVLNAIENYYITYGIREDIRDRLVEMTKNEDEFFQMVANYIEYKE